MTIISASAPGAHGRYHDGTYRRATENHRAPDIWLQQTATSNHGIKSESMIDQPTAMREGLMMGLRLAKGYRSQGLARKIRNVFAGLSRREQN